MKRSLLLLALVCLCSQLVLAERWFPVQLPWDDATPSVIDASVLLVDYPGQDPLAAILSRGRVVARPDGHFYFSRTGRRARFWGVNLTFNANFPDHASAEKVAARLAKLGFNLVRFHHMDFYARPDGVFDPDTFPNSTRHLDPAQLDRWDYLVHQLRSRGLYVNVNLKVARHFGPGDGLAETSRFTTNRFFRGVSHFNPRMIELQQEYALQLLGRRNPYSGLTYAEDPAVFCVEITNEDSLFGSLLMDELNYDPDRPDSLPQLYSAELDQLWNQWLVQRYGNDHALAMAWASDEPPIDPGDRVRNGDFSAGMSHWSVYAIGSQARVNASVSAGAGPDGSPALRAEVTSDGVDWHVQAIQTGHALRQGARYEIRFQARASAPATIRLDMMKGADPWQNYGLSQAFSLTTAWRRYSALFIANETDPDTARITFELGAATRTIWLDDVTFREVGAAGLEESESLAHFNVGRPPRSGFGRYSEGRNLDLMRFYHELDLAYFSGMRGYLRQDLGLRALVSGTAPWWAFLGDIAIQKELDFVDGHYYWDHPWWPSAPDWSSTGWVIGNQSLLNQLDSLLTLAGLAVKGKPFTVSEFNQPFPNQYALEGPLAIALVAAYQDWDAVYMFDYASSVSGFKDTSTRSFFQLAGNPVKIGQMPVAARIFLSGQLASARTARELEVNLQDAWKGFIQGKSGAADWLKSLGLSPSSFLESGIRIGTFSAAQSSRWGDPPPAPVIESDHGSLRWDRSDPQRSRLEIRGEGIQGAFGFIKGEELQFGTWSAKVVGDSPDHAGVLLQVPDRVAWREAPRYLLSVWSEHMNSGQVWNEARNSLENRWGGAPSLVREVVLDLDLMAAPEAEVWALDERGRRKAKVPATARNADRTGFRISTFDAGIFWFEVELSPPAPAVAYGPTGTGVGQLYTDAAEPELAVGWCRIEPAAGPSPEVVALMEYSIRGVLTSLVRIPADPPQPRWEYAVLLEPGKGAAIAFINPGPGERWVHLSLTSSAAPLYHTLNLAPGESKAYFIEELFGPLGSFTGSLAAASEQPFSALALRSRIGGQGEYYLTPLNPIRPGGTTGPLYFAQLARSSVYSTDLVLANPAQGPVHARLQFRTADGRPAVIDGRSEVEFQLGPGAVDAIQLAHSEQDYYGYGILELLSGTELPSASAVITQYRAGVTISETAIPALPATDEVRVISPERTLRWTALAALNPGDQTAEVQFQLVANPEHPVPPDPVVISLAPGERRSFFLREIMAGTDPEFTALLLIRSSAPVSILPLLGSFNSRGDFLLTSLVETDGGNASADGDFVIGRILNGQGYRMLLFWDAVAAGDGSFRFYDPDGKPLALPYRR